MKFALPVAALFVSSFAFCQSDYVVTLKGDTVRGEVRMLSYDMIDRLQVGSGKSKKQFTAVQVRNAHVGADVFVPVKWDNNIRMMKVLRSGFLSLYAFRIQNQTRYDGRIISKMGGTPAEVPNIGFKKIMGNIMEDCPDVSEKIKTGDYDRNNIETIVDDYNKCIAATQGKPVQSETPTVANATTEFIEELRDRVSASDLATKSDVNDLLNSIADKVKKKEPVPGYMKEGLKGYLSSKPEFKEDIDQLMMLLDSRGQ